VAQFWTGRAHLEVPNGLIHDWIGAAFIPGTNVEDRSHPELRQPQTTARMAAQVGLWHKVRHKIVGGMPDFWPGCRKSLTRGKRGHSVKLDTAVQYTAE